MSFPYPADLRGQQDKEKYRFLRRMKSRLIKERNAEQIRLLDDTARFAGWTTSDFWPLHNQIRDELLALEELHPEYLDEESQDYMDPDATYMDDTFDRNIDLRSQQNRALTEDGPSTAAGPIG